MNPIMNKFFSLGPKDPVLKAKFDYYLYWIIFIAFVALAILYFRSFIVSGGLSTLLWAIVISVIAYFNYGALKQFRQAAELMKSVKEPVIETKEEMMNGFK